MAADPSSVLRLAFARHLVAIGSREVFFSEETHHPSKKATHNTDAIAHMETGSGLFGVLRISQQHRTPVRIRNRAMPVYNITPKTPPTRTQPPLSLQ
eukprot:gene21448-8193_t